MTGFKKYDGSYDKQMYDVYDGELVWFSIWPNAGRWDHLCSDEEPREIWIRPTICHSMCGSTTLENYVALGDGEWMKTIYKVMKRSRLVAYDQEQERKRNTEYRVNGVLQKPRYMQHRESNINLATVTSQSYLPKPKKKRRRKK